MLYHVACAISRLARTDRGGVKKVLETGTRSTGKSSWSSRKGPAVLRQYGIPIPGAEGAIESILVVYNDITDEKKEMDETLAARRMSETIVQQNPIPILMTDRSFKVISANPAYVQMSGYALDRITGMNLRDVKIREQKGEGARLAIREKRRAFGEVTVNLPSGTRILEQYVMPLLDSKNEIEHLLLVYNDVTSQRASQQDLAKKMEEVAALKKRSDIIVMQNPMPIMLMDTSFKIVMANEAYTSLTGLSKEKLHGMNAREFKILSQTGEGPKKVLAEKTRSFGEITIEFPKGLRILEQYGIPMLDAQQNISTILCVYVDVTARREQEKKIQVDDGGGKGKRGVCYPRARLNSRPAFRRSLPVTSHSSSASTTRIRSYCSKRITTHRLWRSVTVIAELMEAIRKLDTTIQDTIRSTGEIAKATEQVAISSQKATDNAKDPAHPVSGKYQRSYPTSRLRSRRSQAHPTRS